MKKASVFENDLFWRESLFMEKLEIKNEKITQFANRRITTIFHRKLDPISDTIRDGMEDRIDKVLAAHSPRYRRNKSGYGIRLGMITRGKRRQR